MRAHRSAFFILGGMEEVNRKLRHMRRQERIFQPATMRRELLEGVLYCMLLGLRRISENRAAMVPNMPPISANSALIALKCNLRIPFCNTSAPSLSGVGHNFAFVSELTSSEYLADKSEFEHSKKDS